MCAKTCSEGAREEFQLKNFGLGHSNPKTFVQFQFGYQRVYLVWRIFWACYHVAWIIVTGVRSWEWAGHDTDQQIKWFIYLTDWCYFLLTLSTLVDAIVVTYIFFGNRDIRTGDQVWTPWYVRTNWALFTLGNIASVVVSLAYWSLVYEGGTITAVNVATHMINAIYVIVNVALSGVPVRLFHFWYGILYSMVYALFSYIYYEAGGTNHNNNPYIYSALDWREPGTALMYFAIVSFVACPVVHLFLYAIHAVKLCIYYRARRHIDENITMTGTAYRSTDKAGSL